DPSIFEKLKEKKNLSYFFTGCVKNFSKNYESLIVRGDFKFPEVTKLATSNIIEKVKSSDPIYVFISEMMIKKEGNNKLTTSRCYEQFKLWYRYNYEGARIISAKVFKESLIENKIEVRKISSWRVINYDVLDFVPEEETRPEENRKDN